MDRFADKNPSDDEARAYGPRPDPLTARPEPPRQLSRSTVCNAVANIARANDLPVTFFANLIWQESSFNSRTVSPAGAQGIAQFMPKTAAEFGLENPFEPIEALHAAGRFLSQLRAQFGNLGLAAAAYNAGPGRVIDWMTRRKRLPGETRNYVLRITGRPADQWTGADARRDPEAKLMPAHAPCIEVAEAVKVQAKVVRVSRLMSDLVAATTLHDDAPVAVASAAPARMAAGKAVRGVAKIVHAASKVAHAAKTRVAAVTSSVDSSATLAERPAAVAAARPAATAATSAAARAARPIMLAAKAGTRPAKPKLAKVAAAKPAAPHAHQAMKRTRVASAK